jgi:hypothetical protein
MTMKTTIACVWTLCMLAASHDTLAWGSKGHRITAQVAAERLTPAANAAVTTLLEGSDLATASTWADDMRGNRDNPEFWSTAATWHYVNLAPATDYANSPKEPRGDAVVALETFTAILLDEPLPPGPVSAALATYFADFDPHSTEVKRFALKFALHLLGDLQQPLHAGYAEDRGGNAIAVVWQGETTNLHSLWDTKLLDFGGITEAAYIRRLHNRLDHTPNSDVRSMERIDPRGWLNESMRLLERIHAHDDDGATLETSYAAEFVPTVETQMIKGALRTAYYLNNIFGGWPVAAPAAPVPTGISNWPNSPMSGGLAGR